MANFFGNNKNPAQVTPRGSLETKYNSSVVNLLLVTAFSAINVVLLVLNTDTYFLFSAFIPYFIADTGMFYSGSYPQEYYYDVADMEFFDKSFLIVTVAIAAVVILLYLISWFFARKKKVGWLIFAAVLFCIDTVAMFVITGINTDMVLDIVFHVWVIFSLVNGIVTYYKLKKLPEEEPEALQDDENEEGDEMPSQENSAVLRMADTDVKSRTLLEAEKSGYRIVYRRVKRTNELVVNGRVYDEYEALVEAPHTLMAFVDGHKIEATCDSLSRMYILFDGEQLVKKMRIV